MVLFTNVKIEVNEKEPVCLRCGNCCYYVYEPTGKVKRCKYLGNLRDGSFFCKRWHERNAALRKGWGFKIDSWNDTEKNRIQPVICVNRVDVKCDYPGCPYNRGYEEVKWKQTI